MEIDPLSSFLPKYKNTNKEIDKNDKIKEYLRHILLIHIMITFIFKDISDYLTLSYLCFMLWLIVMYV